MRGGRNEGGDGRVAPGNNDGRLRLKVGEFLPGIRRLCECVCVRRKEVIVVLGRKNETKVYLATENVYRWQKVCERYSKVKPEQSCGKFH